MNLPILFVGPVACALCNRFGSRKIAVFGCLITTLALLGSLAAPHGAVFIVVFALIGGK